MFIHQYVHQKRKIHLPNILSYPNKKVTQYWFSSARLPFLTDLHNIWYKQISVDNSTRFEYKKILPDNISSSLKPIGLAHWCFYILIYINIKTTCII